MFSKWIISHTGEQIMVKIFYTTYISVVSHISRYFNLKKAERLDSRPMGCGIDPNWRHWIVSLSKTLFPLLSTGSTQEDPSRHF